MPNSILKKFTVLFGGFFALVGLGSLFAFGVFTSKSYDLRQHGEHAPGTVTTIDQRWESSSKSGSHYMYAPIFTFQTPDGAAHSIRSSTWSNPPSFAVGDRVDVLYHKNAPQTAIINSFLELWLGSLITGLTGFVFLAIGIACIVAYIQKRKMDIWLVQHGQRVLAKVEAVEINRSIKVNQRSPFQIVASWQDPTTQKSYLFKSENFWEDPTALIQGRTTVDVLIKPDNPKKHLMDLNFIPPTS